MFDGIPCMANKIYLVYLCASERYLVDCSGKPHVGLDGLLV